MPFDRASGLWSNPDEHFFRERAVVPVRQVGPHCVSTVLAMLAGARPEDFQGRVNTQDPVSWSEALRAWSLKLAYCPTDVRKVKHYATELLALDDLFTLSWYTPASPAAILADPTEDGWICGSHVVVLHRDTVLDPAAGTRSPLVEHPGMERHTKRIFRVVPASHPRGL